MHYYRSEIWKNNVFSIYIFNNYNDSVIDVTVLAKGNWTACCEQENAMFLSRDTYHYLHICSMKYSAASEANWFSASQEIPRIVWNPKVQYCLHTCLSACHLSLSSASSIQSMPTHPTSWRSILILSSHLRLGLPDNSLLQHIHSRWRTNTN